MTSEQYSTLVGLLVAGFGANLTLLVLFAKWFRDDLRDLRMDLKEKVSQKEFDSLKELIKEIKDDVKEIKKGTKAIHDN